MAKATYKHKKQPKPFMDWQTADFDECQHLRLRIPMGSLLICKLLDITPEQLIRDILDNLAHGSWKRENRDAAKQQLQEYIIAHRYGQDYYAPDDIRQLFRELDALGLLFPKNGEGHLIDSYAAFREGYYCHWFEKWINLHQRQYRSL